MYAKAASRAALMTEHAIGDWFRPTNRSMGEMIFQGKAVFVRGSAIEICDYKLI